MGPGSQTSKIEATPALEPEDDQLGMGWHFPRDDQGGYGSKPADGAEAVRQLETLRSLGATHIVFPEPAVWWLDEYAGLCEYLEADSGEVARNEAGVVYALPAA